MQQIRLQADEDQKDLKNWFGQYNKVFLVCGNSAHHLKLYNSLKDSRVVEFSDFEPNPTYESVKKGVLAFRESGCEAILAVGGGSAMDVAKCIKLFAHLQGNGENGSWLKEYRNTEDVPFLAVPTTAGSGSEATQFAVLYYRGEKQSITSEACLPNAVLFDPDVLSSLPLYQKKATLCDALSHGIESYWSVHSSEDSQKVALEAISGVLKNKDGYLRNMKEGNAGMMMAANAAGRAINLTKTTAGHAMCYRITGMFGVSHGHAAMLCNRVLFPYLIDHADRCIDRRGSEYLIEMLDHLGKAFGGSNARGGADMLGEFYNSLELEVPIASNEQIKILTESVNTTRLQNFPVRLDKDSIEQLYQDILR